MTGEDIGETGREERPAPRRPVVLLVESNQGDYLLAKMGFERASVPVSLFWVESGEDALQFLSEIEPYGDLPSPDLILLDLVLPVVDGMDVLRTLRADDRFKHIPVVVLTVPRLPTEVSDAYREFCSTYMVKPMDFENYAELIRVLCDYWFRWAVLPGQP